MNYYDKLEQMYKKFPKLGYEYKLFTENYIIGLDLLANDFFCPASADCVEIETDDLPILVWAFKKYNTSGVDAFIVWYSGTDCMDCHKTEKFNEALEELRKKSGYKNFKELENGE